MPLERIDNSASHAEFIDFMAARAGVNLETFDQQSNQTLEDLETEVHERDMVLIPHPLTNQFMRCAQSVKGLLGNPEQRTCLVEVSRTYENGNVVPTELPEFGYESIIWTVRETWKRGENEWDALIRGFTEEIGFTPRRDEIKPRTVFCKQDIHSSTVYYNGLSLVTTTWFDIITSRFCCEEARPIKDGKKIIHLQPRPYEARRRTTT